MRSGTKHLRIASVLQILLGVGSFCAARFLVGEADVSGLGVSGEEALGILALTYGGYVFQVVAGLFGLILAGKKSLFTVILGVLLFVPQLVNFLHTEGNILLIVVNAVALVIPYYYLHNAWKNFKR